MPAAGQAGITEQSALAAREQLCRRQADDGRVESATSFWRQAAAICRAYAAAEPTSTAARYLHAKAGILSGEMAPHAISMRRLALVEKYPPAQGVLAGMYFFGVGLPQDVDRGMQLAAAASSRGSVLGLDVMAVAARSGSGVPQDLASAARFLDQAVARGSKAAQLALAHCYLHGRGVAKDPARGRRLVEQLVARGDVEASVDDDAAALQWYSKAVDGGYDGADLFLAFVYDELYQADAAALHFLKAVERDEAVLPGDYRRMGGFTMQAIAKALKARGLYNGPLTTRQSRRVEKVLQAYGETRMKAD